MQGINTAVLGSSSSADSADPTQNVVFKNVISHYLIEIFKGISGVVFNGNNAQMTITLSTPASQFFWVSMWVYVSSNTPSPTTTYHSILTFVTPVKITYTWLVLTSFFEFFSLARNSSGS